MPRTASLLLACLAVGCGSDGGGDAPDAATDRPDAAPLPTGPLTLYGAGPTGVDNGVAEPCTGPTASGRQVLCVRAGASGTGTAAAPLGTITAALAVARDGDVVQVAGDASYAESVQHGAYKNTCDNAGVALNVSLLGGFGPDFAARDAATYPTTVTGDGTAPAFVVCTMAGASVLDGFVVATGNTDRGIIASAGGFADEGGTLVVSHNVVRDNQAPGVIDDVTFGAGISVHAYAGATVEVSDNHVLDNTSGRGAGILGQAGNTVGEGAVVITRNRVERNTSRGSHGGGMNLVGAVEVSYNVVLDNQLLGELAGGGWGAGFIVDGNSQRPRAQVHHNVVMGNQAASYASGEFYDEDVDATVAFELIRANGCVDERRSSGILVDGGNLGDSTVTFRNLTVIGHRCATAELGALVVQGGSDAIVEASVFWDNLGAGDAPLDFGIDDTGTITVTGTVTQQGHAGADNTTDDPGFVDAAAGNYHSTTFPDRGAFAPGGLSPAP